MYIASCVVVYGVCQRWEGAVGGKSDMQFWLDYGTRIKNMFLTIDWSYLVEFIVFVLLFYIVFKLLKENKAQFIIGLFITVVVLSGLAFSMSKDVESETLLIIVVTATIFIMLLFSTEIKRSLLGTGTKKHNRNDNLTVHNIEYTINEIIRAVQYMSKNNIGALIVLSNENLPEGIVSSGTVINAEINSPMIEAVFYPKAPLHDGAMIIEGDKIHAAGCFLPLIENEGLPQEVGSRHRAALGVTKVAAVTAIVVSEETGIISIMKNGEIKKRYASDAELKNVLSDYYWTDLTAEDE